MVSAVMKSPKEGSPEAIFKEQRPKFKVQRAVFKDNCSKTKVRGVDISWMNKKRGGSLFFMPHPYSLLSTLHSNPN